MIFEVDIWDACDTFCEHFPLAHQLAFFLLHSTGCCVFEFHQVLSNCSALQSPVKNTP